MPTHIVYYLYQLPKHFINTYHPTPNNPKIIPSTPNIQHPTPIIQHPTTQNSHHQHLTLNTQHPPINTPKIQDNILKNNYTISSKTAINKGKNMDKKQICNKHEIS